MTTLEWDGGARWPRAVFKGTELIAARVDYGRGGYAVFVAEYQGNAKTGFRWREVAQRYHNLDETKGVAEAVFTSCPPFVPTEAKISANS